MEGFQHDTAIVLFSGGRDSTSCLAWALERYRHVETIGFAMASVSHARQGDRVGRRPGSSIPIAETTRWKPPMWLDKAATWGPRAAAWRRHAAGAGAHRTHTCYLGERKTLHAWGYGCGHCQACELRRRATRN